MPEPKQLTFTTIGGEVVIVPERPRRKATQPRGYAYHPGTGPAGETCGSCKFIERWRRFRKCNKYREFAKWTHGPGTDVLARSPACKFWEAADANR